MPSDLRTGFPRAQVREIGEGSPLSLNAAFVVASFSLVLVFAAAGAPIPVMGSYRSEGLDNADFAYASCAYFVAAAVGLLVLGRLSTHVGRRPVGMAAVLVAAVGCVLMLVVDGAGSLAVARGLQGLACGVAPGALGAYVIDAAGSRRGLPALVTGSAPMIGLPAGALAVGAIVELTPVEQDATFLLTGGLLAACALLLWLCKETVPVTPGAMRSLVPRFEVSLAARRPLVIVAGIFVATWPLGGFYQAFGSIISEDVLGSESTFAGGAMFATIMILNPIGGLFAAWVRARMGVWVGILAYAAGLVGATAALWEGRAVAFAVCSLACGFAQGLAATSAMRLLLPRTPPQERASVLATIYLIAYSSVALAGLAAGALAGMVDLATVATIYAALGLVAVGAVVLTTASWTDEETVVDEEEGT